jgi:hypothetical protein
LAAKGASNPDIKGLPCCMGLSKTGKCVWLASKACIGKNCRFMRSEEECRNSLMYTFQRLASLDDEKQRYIAEKYYRGRKPWIKYCLLNRKAGGETNEHY